MHAPDPIIEHDVHKLEARGTDERSQRSDSRRAAISDEKVELDDVLGDVGVIGACYVLFDVELGDEGGEEGLLLDVEDEVAGAVGEEGSRGDARGADGSGEGGEKGHESRFEGEHDACNV